MQVIRAALLLILVALTDVPAAAQEDAPAQAIREILAVGAPPVTDIDAALGAEVLAELRRVYVARGERPIWSESQGRALLERLAQPDVTIGPKLRPLLDDARKRLDAANAGADLLLTALYGATAQALRPNAPSGFAASLAELTAAGDVASLLSEPPPPATPPAAAPTIETPEAETPEAFGRTFRVVPLEDWPTVPDGPKLQLGDSGPRVEALSRRLIASADLKAETPGAEFDMLLKAALERFQTRHGLPADGVAGAATLAALNVPAKQRSESLMRYLMSGRDWGDRYLVVNIAAATYRLVDSGRTVAEGPAILGAASTPTLPMDGIIDRIELRPSYRVPQSVADRQLWPRQEEDALYFINHGIRVTDEGLRQVPGAGNPLGVAKLMIAGNDRIALHGAPSGTRSQAAFDLPDRHTSLGCVALPNIAAVVKPLLAADPAWPEGRIDGALAVGGTQTVTLAKPLPLHIVYDTAWIEADGTIQFRNDVYGWDQQTPTADANPIAEPCGS